MNLFFAKLIFQIASNLPKEKTNFDQQFRLIYADSHSQAKQKAIAIGRSEEEVIKNCSNIDHHILWKFVGISELVNLNEVNDGDLFYQNTFETEWPNNFIDLIVSKNYNLATINP